jgi:hypothetical protein
VAPYHAPGWFSEVIAFIFAWFVVVLNVFIPRCHSFNTAGVSKATPKKATDSPSLPPRPKQMSAEEQSSVVAELVEALEKLHSVWRWGRRLKKVKSV